MFFKPLELQIMNTESFRLLNCIQDLVLIGALNEKFDANLGPLIWGATVLIFEPLGAIKYRFAVATVLIMMSTGLWILRKVPDAR